MKSLVILAILSAVLVPGCAAPFSTPAPASTTTAPNIAPMLDPKTIPGAKVWLFAIDDGNPQLAMSAESDGKVLMGRLEVSDPGATITW